MSILLCVAVSFSIAMEVLVEGRFTGGASSLIEDGKLGNDYEPPIAALSATLSARSTTSDVVHDKIFIPTIATMGVLVIVALLCCYMIAINRIGELPRGTNWAVPSHVAPDRVYNQDTSKSGGERDSQNLGRRMSKAQRKSLPPFLPGPSNSAPQAFVAAEQNQYPYTHNQQPHQHGPSSQGYWAQGAPPRSILSSAKSATEVGSDGASPTKTKPYSTTGGYGFSNQNRPAEFGAQRSQHPTVGSQNYNPYDGIDRAYSGNQAGRGRGASYSQKQGLS